MGSYTFIDHTADVGMEVEAADKAELFTLAARGMFAIICDPAAVEPVVEREVEVASDDVAGLLHEWLAELLYLYDTEFRIYLHFDFDFDPAGKRARALIRGEDVDCARHKLHGEIKNVTWCDYVVEETPGGGYFARIVFDI